MGGAITIEIRGEVPAGAVRETERARAVAGLFDLPLERGPTRELFGAFSLTIEPGSVVLITGPSGAGKSTILRGIEAGVRGRGDVRAVRLEEIGLPGDRPVVDCFEEPLDVVARAPGAGGAFGGASSVAGAGGTVGGTAVPVSVGAVLCVGG